ncbi:MAG: DapH/DapD/GlmU-related protein [bacterium]|nr:DapH/DapD/GlmU-related protein [bacterium]
MLKILCRITYEVIGKYLPGTYQPLVGKLAKYVRYALVKGFVASIGSAVAIERTARISSSLRIGTNSGIGTNAFIDAEVTIGEYVMMGPDVAIYTHNHKHDLNGIPFCLQGYEERRPVVIGSNVWIGTRCVILPGVHIGDNVVVGAGSVVTKDVPSGVVVAGSPARVVKKL